jgi:hypothetical protein
MSSAGTAWEITVVMARDATDKNFPGILHWISPANASNTPYRHIFTTPSVCFLADRFCVGIKCRAEFCWNCLNDYNAIRKLGNSEHKPTCEFHSDNLV